MENCNDTEGALAGAAGLLFVISEVLALSGCSTNGVIDGLRRLVRALRAPEPDAQPPAL